MSAVFSSFENISALFNIEIRSINGEKISGKELIEAIEHDIAHYLPVSKTAIFKHFTGNKEIKKSDLERIVSALQHGVIRSMEISQEAALSYAHAAIICGSEANKSSFA